MAKLRFKNFVNLTENEKLIILNWRNSDRVRLKMITQEPILQKQHFQWISSLKGRKDAFYFMVYLDDLPIGVVNIYHLDPRDKSAMWGYYMGDEGIIYAALVEKELLEFFFNKLNFEIIYSIVLKNNESVYKNHKKYFSFKDDDFVFQKLKSPKEGYGISLKKSDWLKREIVFEQKLIKLFSITSVDWNV